MSGVAVNDGRKDSVAASLRRALLLILSIGVVGTLAELYLIGHFEEWWQVAPMALLGLSLPLILGCWVRPGPALLRALQALMLAFVLAGFAGLYQHYTGNAEFELEMYPSRSGWELFRESLQGATPALAPGSMSLLGITGLAFARRHPRLSSGA